MKLLYHRSVPPEVHAACDYYDQQSQGLGDQFFEELRSVIARVSKQPAHYPPLRSGDPRRKALLKRFPYAVIYEQKKNHIKILIVRHHARDPRFGERRT